QLLHSNGRVCVISYHSREDRIVKHFLREMARNKSCNLITKKPVTPTSDETRMNPAARSAKMRVAEKI
ncbi:MAG: 16S rRNA (cytosine(1402)-N(4))-methyltransferase, partial [Thermodesulfovibrionales bacterium]